MDATTAMILMRGAITFGLLAGGIVSMWLGYLLYTSGAGLKRGLTSLELKTGTISLSTAGITVGAVMMFSSIGWAYFSYSSAPKLELTALGGTKVGQTDLPAQRSFAEAVRLLTKPLNLGDGGNEDRFAEIKSAASIAAKASLERGDDLVIYAWPSPGQELISTLPAIREMGDAVAREGTPVSTVVVMTPEQAAKKLQEIGAAIPPGPGGFFATMESALSQKTGGEVKSPMPVKP